MTLEKGKSYGAPLAQQTLADKSRKRLNAPTPHQVRSRGGPVNPPTHAGVMCCNFSVLLGGAVAFPCPRRGRTIGCQATGEMACDDSTTRGAALGRAACVQCKTCRFK
jgi:hypothetical protein